MTAPELKPCPFCGGEAQKFSRANDARHGWAHDVDHWISCTSEACYVTVGMCETEGEAIAAWNTRAPDPDIDAHIGAVLAEAAARVRIQTDLIRKGCGGVQHRLDISCDRIDDTLALRPTALTALDRAKREARVEGMRELLDVGRAAAYAYPDQYGDVWGAAAEAMSEFVEAEERGEGKPQPQTHATDDSNP